MTRLREESQKELGKDVSDVTWRRIRRSLEIDNEPLQDLPKIRAYAFLRRKNPNKSIRLSDVERLLFIRENLPQLACSGTQLKDALMRLKPRPHLATIYRWGERVGIKFSTQSYYTAEQVQRWTLAIAEQTHFKFR